MREHGLRLVARLRRFALLLAAATAVAMLVGFLYAEARGKAVAGSITGALFIFGAVIFVGAASAGGGGRGRRADVGAGFASRRGEMPFGAVLLGLVLIGLGVLTLVL